MPSFEHRLPRNFVELRVGLAAVRSFVVDRLGERRFYRGGPVASFARGIFGHRRAR
jgi:hypothetical protein